MEKKMLYVCSICTKTASPLILMSEEPKNILAAVTSVMQMKNMKLLMCNECSNLVDAVIQFKKIALTGVQNLLRLKYMAENMANVTLAQKSEKKHVIFKKIQIRKPFSSDLVTQSTEINKKNDILKQTQINNKTLHSDAAYNCITHTEYPLSTVTGTESVEIKSESESHLEECTTPLKLNEECHIKEEPVSEFQDEIELEPDINEIQPVSNYSESTINSDTNIVITNVQSLAKTHYLSANDVSYCESTVKVKSEPSGESTDTCESDYGNEEDIILAALAKTNVPTLAYLKETAPVSINTGKRVRANTSKRRRKKKKITVRKKRK